MKISKKEKKYYIALGIVLVILIGVAIYFTSSSGVVRFRTSDLTYNYVIEPQSSIAYSEVKGSQVYAYGLVGYAPTVCEGKYNFLFDIPGTLNSKSVKLYSDSTNTNYLYVCSSNEAIRYSKESWFAEKATVSIDSNSINPELEVNW